MNSILLFMLGMIAGAATFFVILVLWAISSLMHDNEYSSAYYGDNWPAECAHEYNPGKSDNKEKVRKKK